MSTNDMPHQSVQDAAQAASTASTVQINLPPLAPAYEVASGPETEAEEIARLRRNVAARGAYHVAMQTYANRFASSGSTTSTTLLEAEVQRTLSILDAIEARRAEVTANITVLGENDRP